MIERSERGFALPMLFLPLTSNKERGKIMESVLKTKDLKLEGFQTLEQDFFRVCKKLGIKNNAQLLLIYLRGLHCRFGRPDIYRSDAIIIDEMGICSETLRRARKALQQRQVIDYKSSHGRGRSTTYLILKTELAPIIKPLKKMGMLPQKDGFYRTNSRTKTPQKDAPKLKDKKEGIFIPVDRKTMEKDIVKLLEDLNNK